VPMSMEAAAAVVKHLKELGVLKELVIKCAICMYVREGVANDAEIIVEGSGVCMDHSYAVTEGIDFLNMCTLVRTQEDH
jgi:hypothetical protein